MHKLWQFLRTTLIGGFLFLAPLIITIYVLGKGLSAVRAALGPIERLLPAQTMYGIAAYDMVAVVVLVTIAFVSGVIARTRIGSQLAEYGEGLILRWVPGYTLFKSMSQENSATAARVQVVLVSIDDGWVMAFLMERHANGMVTVFVPSAPRPTSGTVYFMRESQVRHLDVPVARVVRSLQQLGIGSRELLSHITWPT